MTERRFRAMGTDVHVIVVGRPDDLVDRAVERIAELERRWSRFLPDSEVSRLNASAGSWLAVSADTQLLVERAVEGWRLTGGGFDPLVLPAVVNAGYGTDFAELASGGATAGAVRVDDPLVACTDIGIDDGRVRLPAGTGFDPGGIGKGLAADLVVEELIAAGAEGVCANLGGDLRADGRGPAGPWTIELEHAWRDEPFARLGLSSGAVATSTTLRRRWTVPGGEHHHLIDPATRRPSDTDVTSATVIAGRAWVAEVLAKAVLLRGAERGFDVVPLGVEAVTVDDRGAIRATDSVTEFLGGVPLATMLAG